MELMLSLVDDEGGTLIFVTHSREVSGPGGRRVAPARRLAEPPTPRSGHPPPHPSMMRRYFVNCHGRPPARRRRQPVPSDPCGRGPSGSPRCCPSRSSTATRSPLSRAASGRSAARRTSACWATGRAFPRLSTRARFATAGVQAAWPLWRAAVALPEKPRVGCGGRRRGAHARPHRGGFLHPGRHPLAGRAHRPGGGPQPARLGGPDARCWRSRRAGASATFVTVSLGSRVVRLTIGALVDFHARQPAGQPQAGGHGHRPGPGPVRRCRRHPPDRRQARRRRRPRRGARPPAREPRTRRCGSRRRNSERPRPRACWRRSSSISPPSASSACSSACSSCTAAPRRPWCGGAKSSACCARWAPRNRQVFALIMTEVAPAREPGRGGLGVALGYGVAQANVRLVSATLSNLYLLEEISRLEMTTGLYAARLRHRRRGRRGRGAASRPRRGAPGYPSPCCRPSPCTKRWATWRRGCSAWAWRCRWPPLCGTVVHGRHWQHAGFVLAVVLLVTLPLLTPLLVRGLCARIPVRGFGLGYSLKGLGVRLQTTSVAVASLAVAVSMLVGVTLMIGSFRQTLSVSIGTSIRADVYISPASWRGTGRDGGLEPDVMAILTRHPAVRAVDHLRRFHGYTGDRRIIISGVAMNLPEGHGRFPLMPGALPEPYRAARERGGVFLGETLARRAGMWVGDTLAASHARRRPALSRRGRVCRLQHRRRRHRHGPAHLGKGVRRRPGEQHRPVSPTRLRHRRRGDGAADLPVPHAPGGAQQPAPAGRSHRHLRPDVRGDPPAAAHEPAHRRLRHCPHAAGDGARAGAGTGAVPFARRAGGGSSSPCSWARASAWASWAWPWAAPAGCCWPGC